MCLTKKRKGILSYNKTIYNSIIQ